MPVLVCQCSCPDASSATRIARALVDERLAACVQQLPGVTSTYRWQDALETAEEVLLLIKTSRACLPTLSKRLVELHPYETPELVALEVTGGLPAYLDWVVAQTRTE